MFQNRIAKYLPQDSQPKVPGEGQKTTPKPAAPKVPPGFIALPATAFGQQFTDLTTLQQQLYREAYEAAKAEAREKLLALLRARFKQQIG